MPIVAIDIDGGESGLPTLDKLWSDGLTKLTLIAAGAIKRKSLDLAGSIFKAGKKKVIEDVKTLKRGIIINVKINNTGVEQKISFLVLRNTKGEIGIKASSNFYLITNYNPVKGTLQGLSEEIKEIVPDSEKHKPSFELTGGIVFSLEEALNIDESEYPIEVSGFLVEALHNSEDIGDLTSELINALDANGEAELYLEKQGIGFGGKVQAKQHLVRLCYPLRPLLMP